MGGGYNPGPYGGTGVPVGKGVAGMNYLTSALSGLEQGYQQKRQREGAALTKQLELAKEASDKAIADTAKYGGDPNLSEQMKKQEAEATDNYEKLKSKVQKHFGANPTVFSALWDKLKTAKGTPQGVPPPQGAKPVPAPPPGGANQSAPPAAPDKAQSLGYLMANFDAVKAKEDATRQAAISNMGDLKTAVESGSLNETLAQHQAKRRATIQIASAIKAYKAGTVDPLTGKPVDFKTAANTIWEQHNLALNDGGGLKSALDFAYRVKATGTPQQQQEADQFVSDTVAASRNEAGKPFVEKLTPKHQAVLDGIKGHNPAAPLSEQPEAVQSEYYLRTSALDESTDDLTAAKVQEIKAQTQRLSREEKAKAKAKGKPETTQTMADHASRVISSIYNSTYSGTNATAEIDPTQKMNFEQQVAKAFVEANPDFAKNMGPGEDPLVFINRMRISPPQSLAVPAPKPGSLQNSPASPPAGAVPPGTLSGTGKAASAVPLE